MNDKVRDVFRFLFPEWQIVEAVREQGLIARKRQEDGPRYGMAQGAGSAGNAAGNAGLRDVGSAGNARLQGVAPATAAQAVSGISGKAGKDGARAGSRPAAGKAEERLEGLECELRETWIGSEADVEALCQAFSRPYLLGSDGAVPKTAILIVGGESRGKRFAVTEMARILKQRKVFRYAEVPSMDMGGYPANGADALFLSDLYKALYGPGEVVLFEHIDRCPYKCLSILQQLLTQGSCRLDKRYVSQNNMLVESAGVLNADAVSELSANGKVFVFTSCLGAREAAQFAGQEFMRRIQDVIELESLGEPQLEELARVLCDRLAAAGGGRLRMRLAPDEGVLGHLARMYDSSSGVRGLSEHMEDHIYKPLAEYRLENPSPDVEEAVLSCREDGYFVLIGGGEVPMASYERAYDALALEEVKRELDGIVGLDAVKGYVLNLENNLKVQKLRESRGLKAADVSMHMIFTGNPGTGKTTIARIVANYLKAMGALSSGQLREVSRSDLVGQYVGQTASLTAGVIDSAVGGVLFIDEAYSLCRDENDAFGREAVDALVRGIENERDNLVVILAGYEDEMERFLKTNPGLKSRFPNVIRFEDYTPEEMYEIALATAGGKGYRISEESRGPLLEEFERRQIKGRNDGGNGRLVRNLLEAAIVKQSQRVAGEPSADLEMLRPEDFGFGERKPFQLEEELAGIVGLETVKEFVRTQYHMVLAGEKRKKAELKVDTTQTLNMVFTGNPGTGKTTVARVVAGMFHAMGLLKSGHLVETDKGGLVAEYVGQTARKTEEVFKSALGGVLFIDEAYAITNGGGGFGQECVDTLVKLIEEYRGEIMIILAGYRKEMQEFMEANSGLESRFPLQIEFPDYSAQELFEIGKRMVASRGFCLSKSGEEAFREKVYEMQRHADAASGNGRMVRNLIEQIIRKQSSRIAVSDVPDDEMGLILLEDIQDKAADGQPFDLEAEWKGVIGLESVKRYIRSLNARLKMQKERRKAGLKTDDTQTLHMVFMGNPGTGKTMMARTVAKVLSQMGAVQFDKLVEVDRSGLVAGYVGQTAIKTRQAVEGAFGGVLFIDEAYALAQGGENDFGREAIDTLVKMMDDNRDRLVVILAGYREDMRSFLEQNAGLKSRFPNQIEFEDYTTEELLVIADGMYTDQGYRLDAGAREKLARMFDEARMSPRFGNGRYVRNVYERSLNSQALRLSASEGWTRDDLMTVTEADIEEVS